MGELRPQRVDKLSLVECLMIYDDKLEVTVGRMWTTSTTSTTGHTSACRTSATWTAGDER